MTYKEWLSNWNELLLSWDMTYSSSEQRPWGGFISLHEKDAKFFCEWWFGKEISIEHNPLISPKLLFILPGEQLSWQYHNRRSEVWRIIENSVGFKISENDNEPVSMWELGQKSKISIKQGQRHCLIGLETYCTIGEIWVHDNLLHPSNESDIIRITDKYER